MAYTYNPMNLNYPNFVELDEVVMQIIKRVVENSQSGNLGAGAYVDMTYTEGNLQLLENTNNTTTLITVGRDDENLNNYIPQMRAIGIIKPTYNIVYDIYVRISADRQNISKMIEIRDELIAALTYNISDGSSEKVILTATNGFSNSEYEISLYKNTVLPLRNIQREQLFNQNFFTSILSILFKIKKNT